MGEVFAVISGKGGTGKTSLSAGIATALASSGKSVLCIDCDVGLRNLDISLGMSDSGGVSFLDVCSGSYPLDHASAHPLYPTLSFLTAPMNCPPEQIDPMSDSGGVSFLDVCSGSYPLDHASAHPLYPTLSFLTAPMNCPPEQIDPAAFTALLRNARSRFDYVFLDAPAGVDAGFRLGFRLCTGAADRFLLVTGAGPAAVRDAARVSELLELQQKQDVRLIVNRVSRNLLSTTKTTIDDIMDTAGLPLCGMVPEDNRITLHHQNHH